MTQENKELQVFDVRKGMEQYEGEEEVYLGMRENFETMSLDPGLIDLHKAVLKRDWHNVWQCAHKVKSPAGYVHAEKLIARCSELEQKGKIREAKDERQDNPEELTKLEQEIAQDYFSFVDAAIEVKLFLAKYKGELFDPSALEELKIEVSKAYKVKIESSGNDDHGFEVDTSTKKSVSCAACTCTIF